jgi:hypothetical protein
LLKSVFGINNPKPFSGMKSISPGPNNDVCGLVIEQIPPNFSGDWKCNFQRDQYGFNHQGRFTILTKDELFVKVLFLLFLLG